ncbi:P-loop containing nucleoside triphosphate hydrolase protein [Globomyces pollinis-pini]|nr:P-loop containing nucleoside triphosphate hydrolase protein [Globomyces pollinis-pini]
MDNFKEVHPIKVEVRNLSISIKQSSTIMDRIRSNTPEDIKVISNISFDANPGQIFAIMGSSGSGKTTLLHTMAGRAKNSIMTGDILFDGINPKQFHSNGNCGYVQQFDYLMPHLTVRETLMYTAELRLPSTMSIIEKRQSVESVILELGLKECADTVIGDSWVKGISGGEKRRVSVGCQLLLNPSILFLDEPTTGLDAYSSHNLIETLKSLADRGRTIFITIHQPRSDIFNIFDSVILLAKGNMVYAGPAGTTIMNYFENLCFVCPLNINPADYIIDITSVDGRTEEDKTFTETRVSKLIQDWITNTAKLSMEKSNTILSQDSIMESKDIDDKFPKSIVLNQRRSGANWFSQTLILIRRTWVNQFRDRMTLWGMFFEVIFVGVVFGSVYFQLPEELPGVLSRRAALYTISSIQTYLMLIFFVNKIVSDMKVFDRERTDRMYRVFPYVMGTFIAQIPLNVLFPTIYSFIMYFMVGLRMDDFAIHFFRFASANVLAHFVIVAFSQFSVSVARDFSTASLIGNALYAFFSYSCGFFIQLDSIPVYLRWISKISYLTFEFRLLSSNEFTDNVYKCEDVGRPCEGNSILESLAIERNDYTYTYIGLVGNWLVFMILSIVLLQYYKIDPTKHAKQLQKTKKKKEVVEMELKEFNSRKVDLTLKNVSLELTTKPMFRSATNKMLLSNISGTFSHSSLSIVMGGSGTGKSTLLSLLCGRSLSVGSNSKMKQSGSILFNGKEIKDQSIISSICSFVRQSDDHLLPSLTCRETLVYAARLRLPQSFTEDMKVSRALEVLRLLGLSHCADTIVGSETSKGLSGGEKRRLSIGIQMLVDPSVLIIDEPTSGLDAFTAHHIMETLKSIANTGRTIICSIHQPRSDIFVMFDHILLLTLGGRVAYSGSAKSIIPYFQQMDIDIPTHINPADLILDVTSIDFRNSLAEQQSKKRIEDIITVWKNTGNNVDLEKSSVIDQLDVGEIYARKMLPMSKAFPILLERSYLNIKREPTILLSRILQVVSLGIIQALFFTPQGNDQASVQNRLGILQQSNSVLFVGLLNCVAAFPTEKAVLFYEYNDRAYSVESFFLAYNLLEIPVEIVSAFLFTIFTQIVVGLNVSWTNYICMSLAIFGLVNTGESIGIMFTSIVGHVGFSVSMTSCVLGIFTVMSGIMSSDMPLFLDRINRISPVPYFARLMVVNEFDSTSRFTCTTEEKSTQQCLYETGDDVLRLLKGSADTMSFDPNQVSFYLVVGMALAVFYRLVSYLLLRYRTMSN